MADSGVTPACHHACHLALVCDTRSEADVWKERPRMTDDRPSWARRITASARPASWSQADAIRALRLTRRAAA